MSTWCELGLWLLIIEQFIEIKINLESQEDSNLVPLELICETHKSHALKWRNFAIFFLRWTEANEPREGAAEGGHSFKEQPGTGARGSATR